MKLDRTRILVVDDEMSLRELLSEVLTDDGYDVTIASTAEKALRLFAEDPFPLVITDIRMPGMNGIDLLKKIKTENKDTQVIIITSHASLDTAVTALREGAYDYLIKPFEDLDVISVVVGRALEKMSLVVENRLLLEKLRINNQELEEANSFLHEMAIRDGLTGLYNHRHFQEALTAEVMRSRRHEREFSLIFFDVDHFKTFNDTHGHPEGDALLKKLGQLMQERLRNTDIACRYGGEEFVLLLPETSKRGAVVLAENLRMNIETTVFIGAETQPMGQITVSIGVATFPGDGEEAARLLENVDQALYRAKQGGRNRVVVVEG